jgi:predicted house-cleaning NTP pyrophosphatase (Maf/HAM1 superfamily)
VICRDLRQFSGNKIQIGTGLQLFAKYNKNYQNVNSKRLQLTAVYFSTVKVYLELFFNFVIMASDIHAVATATTPQRAYNG